VNELLTYVMTAQQLGVSANVALKLWVASGRPIRRQRFYQAWRDGEAAAQVFPVTRRVA
jgi:hypothetical protein